MTDYGKIYSNLATPTSYPVGVSKSEEDEWIERSELASQLAGLIVSAQGGRQPSAEILADLRRRFQALSLPANSHEGAAIAALEGVRKAD